jgi:hypothetical protein
MNSCIRNSLEVSLDYWLHITDFGRIAARESAELFQPP